MRARQAWMALAIGLGMTASPVAAMAQKVGVIGAVNPAAASKAKAAEGTRTLSVGNDVFFEDMITTDAAGNAQVMFLDRSSLTVGPNSNLTIDRFVYDPATSAGALTVKGTKGVFRFVGGALSKKEPVKIQTPVATIGIRGGIVLVEVAPDGATTSTMVYGLEMTMQNRNGDIQRTTQPGTAIDVKSAVTPPSVPYQVSPSALSARIQRLTPAVGTHGGATDVPTGEQIQESRVGQAIAAAGEAAPPPQPAPDADSAPAPEDADEIKLNQAPAESETEHAGSVIGEQTQASQALENSAPSILQQADGVSGYVQEVNTTADVIGNRIDVSRRDPQSVYRKLGSGGDGSGGYSGRYFEVSGQGGGITEHGLFQSFLKGDAMQFAARPAWPHGRAPFSESLPVSVSEGLQVYDYQTQGGYLHTSFAYFTANRNMFYFHDMGLNHASVIDSQINLAGGRVMPADRLPTSGIQAFYVLPQLEIDFVDPHELNMLAAHYAPSGSMLPPMTLDYVTPQDRPGLYINWSTGAMLSGVITEEGAGTIGVDYEGIADVVALMGRVNRNNAAQPVNGFYMNFASDVSDASPAGNHTSVGSGAAFAAGGDMYGGPVAGNPNHFAGMLLQTREDGTPNTLPVMEGPASAAQKAAFNNQQSSVTQGFAAGFVANESSGVVTGYDLYESATIDSVRIVQNLGNGTVGGRITMKEDGSAEYLHAWFGTDTSHNEPGAPPVQSAAIAHGIYGAQQGMVRRSQVNDALDTSTPAAVTYPDNRTGNTNGVILSGHFAEGVSCTQCQFVDWGVWAGEIGSHGGGAQNQTAHMVYYVNGQPTQVGQLPTTSTPVAFSGVALGAVVQSGTGGITHHHDGIFGASVNFASRQVSNLSIQIPSANTHLTQMGTASFYSATATNPAVFVGGFDPSSTVNGSSLASGSFRGGFFGPAGQSMGGTFNAGSNAGDRMTGIFMGGRP